MYTDYCGITLVHKMVYIYSVIRTIMGPSCVYIDYCWVLLLYIRWSLYIYLEIRV